MQAVRGWALLRGRLIQGCSSRVKAPLASSRSRPLRLLSLRLAALGGLAHTGRGHTASRRPATASGPRASRLQISQIPLPLTPRLAVPAWALLPTERRHDDAVSCWPVRRRRRAEQLAVLRLVRPWLLLPRGGPDEGTFHRLDERPSLCLPRRVLLWQLWSHVPGQLHCLPSGKRLPQRQLGADHVRPRFGGPE